MPQAKVLIVGAGPTGLVLALCLARRGVPFRLIDDGAGPGDQSRAMAVHARTLEFYRQFGFADEMVAEGVKADIIHLREGGAGDHDDGREIARFSFKDLGQDLSPYPFLLTYPQDAHERFLVRKLEEAGGSIEWNTRLTWFEQDEDGIRATITRSDETSELFAADYICGCDGAHSRVRETIGVGFAGGTYSQLLYVADVKIASGFDPDIYINLGEDLLALMLPVRASGMQRLIGLVPPALSERHDLTFEDLREKVEPLLGVEIATVNWFSTYRVHHRVAEHFQIGRAFLLGDAGHLHSPAGGQGMNTGIGDAINLGWKLASVLQKRADGSLLATYEPERIAFARTLVATTDRAFSTLVSGGLSGKLIRRLAAPLIIGTAARFEVTRHLLFKTVSQIEIHYPNSPLSDHKAGRVSGGDRLPWLRTATGDNFAALQTLEWQVHVYGSPQPAFLEAARGVGLPVHVYPWSDMAENAGFARDAVYIVRPDAYVGLAMPSQDAAALAAYFDRLQIRPSLA